MEINIRSHCWDQGIFECVVSGEYGQLDFQGATVVDIGAHIGAFSILASLKGARRVFAFEAWSENYDLLVKNCRHLAGVECNHAAVWRSDRDDTVLRWTPPENKQNTGGGTVIECSNLAGEPLHGEARLEVTKIPFDDIVDRVGTIDILKIDAEGSEYPILFTSDRLDRVSRIVGEYHEIKGRRPTMEIPGFPDWNIQALSRHLANRGFTVTIEEHGHLGLFKAVRPPPA